MNARELVALGLPRECVAAAYDALKASGLISEPAGAMRRIGEILASPEGSATDPHFGALATALLAFRAHHDEAIESCGRNPTAFPPSLHSGASATIPGRLSR